MARDTARALIAATDRLCRVVLENAVNVPDIRPLASAVHELCAAVRAFARPEVTEVAPEQEKRAAVAGFVEWLIAGPASGRRVAQCGGVLDGAAMRALFEEYKRQMDGGPECPEATTDLPSYEPRWLTPEWAAKTFYAVNPGAGAIPSLYLFDFARAVIAR